MYLSINVNLILFTDEYDPFWSSLALLSFWIFWLMLRSMFNIVYKLCIYRNILINQHTISRSGEKSSSSTLAASFFSLSLTFLPSLPNFILTINDNYKSNVHKVVYIDKSKWMTKIFNSFRLQNICGKLNFYQLNTVNVSHLSVYSN